MADCMYSNDSYDGENDVVSTARNKKSGDIAFSIKPSFNSEVVQAFLDEMEDLCGSDLLVSVFLITASMGSGEFDPFDDDDPSLACPLHLACDNEHCPSSILMLLAEEDRSVFIKMCFL